MAARADHEVVAAEGAPAVVTSDAARRRPPCAIRVARVIEARVEALQGRKRSQVARGRVRVTDRADRTRLICELLCVTTRTGHVTGQLRLRRIRFAPVAEQTRQTRVRRVRVPELGKI